MKRILSGAAALITLTAVLVGLPVLLVAVGGIGVPHVGSVNALLQALMRPDDGTLALTLIKAAGWISWAILTGTVLLDIVARARRLPVPRLRGFTLPQSLAHQLVGAAAAIFVVAGSVTSVTGSTPAGVAPPPAAAAAAPSQAHSEHSPDQTHAQVARQKDRTYTVKKGDTLSEIALETTGKAANYPKLFQASRHTVQPGGYRLSDPDVIDVGWTITIPDTHPRHVDKTPKTERTSQPRPTTPATGRQRIPDIEGASPARPAPTQPTPDSQPTVSHPTSDADDPSGQDHAEGPSWLLSGFAGAGALLAAAVWLELRRRRAAQFRSRRPGRMIAAPTAALTPVEKTLRYQGAPTGELLEFVDEVLRRLAAGMTAAGHAVPQLVGVDVTDAHLTVRLRTSMELDPSVWTAMDGTSRQVWRIERGSTIEAIGSLVADEPAPWPQLVTLGRDDHGWRLVNLEALGVITLTGDATFAGDLARYIVTELAVAPWARDVEIDCLDICEELPGIDPARVRFHHDPRIVAQTVGHAVAVIDRLNDIHGDDLGTARVTSAGDELWESRILVSSRIDAERMDILAGLIQEHSGHTATSLMLLDDTAEPRGVTMQLTNDGHLRVHSLGLELVVNGLTEAEARGCVALLAAGAHLDDEPMPPPEHADREWQQLSEADGSLRPGLTLPRHSTTDEPAHSLLPDSDAAYLHATANTAEDLDELAPLVTEQVRDRVHAADPDLDHDLELWRSPSCDRPRLHVLGPVKVRLGTTGEPIRAATRIGFSIAMVAYLSTRGAQGASKEQIADAFNISEPRVRRDLTIVRAWLGNNPHTGAPFIPPASSRGAGKHGTGRYRLEGCLTDADLFRRLRLRGESRGGDEGMADLKNALSLVSGTPYDSMREGQWLADTRIDQHMLCAIVDVAHTITTNALAAGDTNTAIAAAQLAQLAAPDEATPMLDLAAIAAHQGEQHRAAAIARDALTLGGQPVDPSTRSESILRAHRWLTKAS